MSIDRDDRLYPSETIAELAGVTFVMYGLIVGGPALVVAVGGVVRGALGGTPPTVETRVLAVVAGVALVAVIVGLRLLRLDQDIRERVRTTATLERRR